MPEKILLIDGVKYELWTPQKEVEEFLDLFREVLSRTKILMVDPDDLSKVAGIAIDEMMSFYDASYIIAAKDRDLTLVTEDTQLTKVASKHVRTMSSKEIISAS